MRPLARSLLPAVAALALLGCGNGAGPSDLGVALDLSGPAGPLACGDYVNCLNTANGDPTMTSACDGRATTRAAVLFQSLNDCISNQCASDGGLAAGGCGTLDQCIYCVQSGRSPTGHNNGACTDDIAGQMMVSDPKCGLCVDAVLACFSDVL
jgi:hypothetical protein